MSSVKQFTQLRYVETGDNLSRARGVKILVLQNDQREK